MNLTGNTVLITGGTSGIGLQMAKEFLKRENTVIITSRSQDRLEKVKTELPDLHIYQCDSGNPDDILKLTEQVEKDFPNLNVLINNAGLMWYINLQNHKMSLTELTTEMDVNFKGTVQMNEALLPLLKAQPIAATVAVSSGLAFAPLPTTPIYCATKAALHSYSISLRAQLSNTSIKVFELAPPATETPLLDDFDPEDMKGTSMMPVEKLVEAFMKGFEKDQFEICPGQASQLRFMSRFMPGVIMKVLSKPVARMHAS